MLFYDAFLLFSDEVEYIWPTVASSKKTDHRTRIVMIILLFTRYLMLATAIESLFSESTTIFPIWSVK